nr:MAG TPA: hypothetical protein [Caudoviricetes sp.]
MELFIKFNYYSLHFYHLLSEILFQKHYSVNRYFFCLEILFVIICFYAIIKLKVRCM